MARTKKKSRRPANTGCLFKRREGGPWIARWFDHTGRRREQTTSTTDRAAAERILAKRIAAAAERKHGVVDPRIDRYADAARKPLSEHLTDFLADVRARGGTAQHVQQLETRIKRTLALARAEWTADLNGHAVQMAIADIRNGDNEHRSASIQTAVHYLRNVKQFSRWLKRDGRIAMDPLAELESAGNPETDRKRERRPLTDDELALVIKAAEHGGKVRRMLGVDRAMMYRLAIGTGYRAGELRSLTPESFNLQAEPPTVTVEAAYSKHRRVDVQPIRPELAELLRKWLDGKPARVPVFRLRGKVVNILKADLKAARAAWLAEAPTGADRAERQASSFLCYVDHAGRYADFHALRHGYISRLVAGGASVKTSQELARHSNPMLTIGRYAHARLNDLTAALDVLPCPPSTIASPEQQEQTAGGALQATGTDDYTPDNSARQSAREMAVSGDTPRSANLVFGGKNAVFGSGSKKSPGRGDRGHWRAIRG